MSKVHKLPANTKNVKWGYYDHSWEPVLHIESGDFVDVEALNHQSGDAPDLMFDDAIREIYDFNAGRDMGDHLVTGPIYVEGAKVGDVIEIKVIDMEPRLRYGSNVLANWGRLADDFNRVETIFIYEVDHQRKVTFPVFTYTYPRPINAPGLICDPETVERIAINDPIEIPVNYHFGVAGVLPAESGRVHSLHPKDFGGNVDNKNHVMGTSMFYRVQVAGAGVYVGDTHAAQGDGEYSGTAVECSINGRIQIILHKDYPVKNNPILETKDNWQTHGYAKSLDDAIRLASLEAIDFMVARYKISRELAYSILSVKCDFHVTQVANGIKGIHCIIPKVIFNKYD